MQVMLWKGNTTPSKSDNFSPGECWQASLSLEKVLSGFCRVEAGCCLLRALESSFPGQLVWAMGVVTAQSCSNSLSEIVSF